MQTNLFADFNGTPEGVDRTEFYQHDQNWSNRMILGDSLQGMASVWRSAKGLRGKVQCIYLDPPYGIKFNSNFQWSTTSRNVKDGTRPITSRARTGAGEGVSGHMAGRDSLLSNISTRPADRGAGSTDGERLDLRTDWG